MNLNNKEFLCITCTVELNFISPSSIVGIQLRVSALYGGHLHLVLEYRPLSKKVTYPADWVKPLFEVIWRSAVCD